MTTGIKRNQMTTPGQSAVQPGQAEAPVTPPVEAQRTATLQAEAPDTAVPEGTATDFAASQTGPRTGDSPLNVQINAGQEFVSQAEMNQNAGNKLEAAQAKMMDLITELRQGMEPLDAADLLKAQSTFDDFVHAQSTFEGNLEARGGSLMPLIYAGTAQQLVEARTALLEKVLEEGWVPGDSSAQIPDDAPQQMMNMLAGEALGKTEARMRDTLVTLETKLEPLDDLESLKELMETQRTWEAFCEAHATFGANLEARGGSLAGLIWPGIAESTTNDRIAQLESVIKILDDLASM